MDKKIRLLGIVAVFAVAIAGAYWQLNKQGYIPQFSTKDTQEKVIQGSSDIDTIIQDIASSADAEYSLASEADAEAAAAKDDNINLDLNYEANF